MTDFAEAFRLGQLAAKKSSDANAEINDVLDSLKNQVLAATGGKLEINVDELPDIMGFGSAMRLASAFANARVVPPAPGKAVAKGIYIRNILSSNTASRRIANWLRPHEGFPCSISFNNREIGCHDRDGLERGLGTMLADAWVAEQILAVLRYPEKLSDGTEGIDGAES
jgi:hypothetical protein